MELPRKIVEGATTLDSVSFERLRDEWLRPPYNQYGLDLLREKARNERDLHQYYQGHAPLRVTPERR